ncbi:hypothetical protein HALLA_03875 (plasmid) [Halostagnicola larsenii XH-48]|uniref:Orc1-like AAA ATPase domain-containing protein n=1 Tax=Halostagnicola larsenii XH-48 TaxID=797299 RepID=W0JW38_9EURY|nr:orc1/cdc6 family replication initiation protein [Halostagnicola larsenii]AHG01542.1 hypothetical protein HALLA_03875 [Halostagnicola larsenii XH-48]
MIVDQDALELKKATTTELIVHRNSEINTLLSIFEPVTNGHQTSGAFIYGPPGLGKTCAANVLLNEIRRLLLLKMG